MLLISIDTCRADYVEPCGGRRARTPALSAIARDGAAFPDAVTPVPLTVPAHASMFTGLHPVRTGVHDNTDVTLGESAVTIAERFHNAGYVTGGVIGAILLSRRAGFGQGFDAYDDQFPPQDFAEVHAERTGLEVVDRATRLLDGPLAAAGKPFFLFVHFYGPHPLHRAPAPWSDEYAGDGYGAEIAYVDHCIGKFVDALKRRGLYDDLVIMVVGDHGEGLGDHRAESHGLFLYDEAMRIPFLVRAPATLRPPAPRSVAQTASLLDVAPTLAELAGIPRLDGDGISLLPWLTGDPPSQPRALLLESRYPLAFGWSPQLALRDGTWKAIRSTRPELYRITDDPREDRDLQAAEPEQAARLQALLSAQLDALLRAPALAPGAVAADRTDELLALGYAAGSTTAAAAATAGRALPDPKDRVAQYALLDRGLMALSVGDTDAAITMFRHVSEADPDNPMAWLNMGIAHLRLKQFDLAITALATARTLAGELPSVEVQLARAYVGRKALPEARGVLEPLLARHPQLVEAHVLLASVDAAEGHFDTAHERLLRAQGLQPDLPGLDDLLRKAATAAAAAAAAGTGGR